NRGKRLRIDVAVALRGALDRVRSESRTVVFWLFVFHTLTSFPLILDSSLLHSNTRPFSTIANCGPILYRPARTTNQILLLFVGLVRGRLREFLGTVLLSHALSHGLDRVQCRSQDAKFWLLVLHG